MSLFNTTNVVTVAATGSSTIAPTTDLTIYTLTAAAAATLPSSSGQYAGLVFSNRTGGQGITYIQNASTSTSYVTVTAASGDTVSGVIIVSPGQTVKCESNGTGVWQCTPVAVGGFGQRQVSVIPISSAAWLAFRTTPTVLAPTPPTGKCNIVERISLKMITTATQYTSGGALEFRYTDASGTKVTADIAAAVVTTTAGTSFTTVGGIEASLTGVINAPVVALSAAADFATGTGTGILTCVYYVQN